MSAKKDFREWYQSLSQKDREKFARLSGYSVKTVTKKFATGYQTPRALGMARLAKACSAMRAGMSLTDLMTWFHQQAVSRHG